MNKTYHLFISHSWAYSDAYEKLIGLLDKDSSFAYTNYSVPKDDPLHTNGTDSELYAAIKEQISQMVEEERMRKNITSREFFSDEAEEN